MADIRTVPAVCDDDLLRDAGGRVVCEFCYAVMEVMPMLDEGLQEVCLTQYECRVCGSVDVVWEGA